LKSAIDFSDNGDCQDEGTNCDIEDVEVTVESRDSDLDVDEDIDFDTIRADRNDMEQLSFEIPDDIDEDDYDIEMFLTGTDENGARHGDYWTFTLDVEVPDNELVISSYDLFPSQIDCNVNKVTLSVTLENTGTSDQDRGAILIESARLDIKESIYRIEIDSEDRITKTFDLALPDDLIQTIFHPDCLHTSILTKRLTGMLQH